MDSSPAFLYYNPEGPTQSRHQFVSQPPSQKTTTTSEQLHASAASSSASMPFPSALVYQSRPSSSSHMKPQHIHAPTPIIATSVESLQKSSGLLTPSSPNLLGLDGPNGGDMYFFPPTSTPDQLNTGLHTPLHSPWGLDDSCSGTVTPSDMQLSPSTPDVWKARSPMSPAYNLPMNHFMSGDSSPTLMLSSCPSLSPTSSQSGDEIDFCDPRQLTTYPLSPHHSESDPCPFIAGGDADDHFLLHPITIKLEDDASCKSDIDLLSPFSTSFDVTPAGTINPADLLGSPSLKRTREEDEDDWDLASTFSDESILESSDLLMPLSPPASDLSRATSLTPPSRKKSKPAKLVDEDLELDAIIESSRLRGVDSEHTFSPPTFPHTPAASFNSDSDCHDHSDCHSHDHSQSETSQSPEPSSATGLTTTTPVVRRGRKQSLTADPSKTFACHLCTRRFRRQEHLKRHFRSLHTREKPFSCPECGKKFSRSDNLSQHARTHGSATIHMTMCEDMLGAGGMVLIEDERREEGECCGDE